MIRPLLAILMVLHVSMAIAQQASSTACNEIINTAPMDRTTGTGEENVVNGIYQGLAQQYNGMTGQIHGVRFYARVNPASPTSSNTVKVIVYNANLDLPGVIVGSQNVIVNAAAACYEVNAIFTTPLNVNGNIIISIEPFSPSTDNFYVQRNTPPDGQNLNLVKIKQANQWFKNLAAGDPAFDFDFHILPLRTKQVTASFTSNTISGVTSFVNTSVNASVYNWDFDDGTGSSLTSPSHNYNSSGIYNVKLAAFADVSATCGDSITIPVNVVLSGINESHAAAGAIMLLSSNVSNVLELKSTAGSFCEISDVLGKKVKEFTVEKDEITTITIESLKPGIYYLRSEISKPITFIKTDKQ